MPSLGGGNVDIRSIIGSIVNFAKSKTTTVCTAPCDGLVLKMHYRWTFFVFLAGFFSVWYSWYQRDVITCVSHFNADTQVRLDYINVCLSYPYIQNEDESRRYLLFYRWIHWTFLVLAGVYYIPRKVSKVIENSKVKRLMDQLASNSARSDNEREIVEHALRYINYNKHTHNGLYYKYVIVNLVALSIDFLAIHFLDFILQNRFITYGIKAYPYDRDPKEFTDYMSVTFPPFAECELAKPNQLTARRSEKLGCHLTFMELYEKLFLFLWLWLYLLIIVTIVYLLFIGLFPVPCFQSYLLKTAKPEYAKLSANGEKRTMNSIILSVTNTCKVGDVYLLYRLKQHFSHARFYELLTKLSANAQQGKDAYLQPTAADLLGQKQAHPDSVRNRKKNVSGIDPPHNPDYLQLLHPGRTQQQQQDIQQRTPLLSNKNTSILIE